MLCVNSAVILFPDSVLPDTPQGWHWMIGGNVRLPEWSGQVVRLWVRGQGQAGEPVFHSCSCFPLCTIPGSFLLTVRNRQIVPGTPKVHTELCALPLPPITWHRNIVHASDSVEGAQREIQLWFQSSELVDWAEEGHQSSTYPA